MESKADLAPPLPKIKQRKVSIFQEKKGIEQGLHPVLARIIATRQIPEEIDPKEFLFPKLNKLSNPNKMADMEIAANRLVDAIINKECIGLETDHDCDGQTSHAIFYYNLVNHFNFPKEQIRSYIGHRLKEGYGLSESLALRILNDTKRPTLLITADNGSTDEPRIKQLASNGIEVIVTDHHQIPFEGCPKSAIACLNPTRSDCKYEDKYIAGCMVAWLLMVVVRQKLIERKYLPTDAPRLKDTLDYVAVGTVADCVSLSKSYNNRVVVTYGLKLIQNLIKPCWRAVAPYIKEQFDSNDLAFRVGPLLNSDGRLSSALDSVSFLLSETDSEASEWVEILHEQNKKRKAIQKTITQSGMKIANVKVEEGNYSLSIFLEKGHSGVHGISASRIKEAFGRPTVFLAPKFKDKNLNEKDKNLNENEKDKNQREKDSKENNLVTGSVRGIDNKFNVLKALQYIAKESPGIFIAFGGHEGAGGLTIKREDVDKFSSLFEKASRLQLKEDDLGPVILSDGELRKEHLTINFIELINKLEPFGRGFEAPIFHAKGILTNIYPVGDGSHTKVSIKIDGRYFKGIWFNKKINKEESKIKNADEVNEGDNKEVEVGESCDNEDSFEFKVGDNIVVAFSLIKNFFNGVFYCELQIVTMEYINTSKF